MKTERPKYYIDRLCGNAVYAVYPHCYFYWSTYTDRWMTQADCLDIGVFFERYDGYNPITIRDARCLYPSIKAHQRLDTQTKVGTLPAT